MKHTHQLLEIALCVLGFQAFVVFGVCSENLKAAEAQATAPEYRFPPDTSGPGLRLVSLFHDTRSATFTQGLRTSSDANRRSVFSRPRYVAFGRDGAIYTLDGARGVVYKTVYQDDRLTETTLFPKSNRRFRSPIAIACAPDGSLWLTDSRRGSVFVIDAEGTVVDSISDGLTRPVGIVYHPGLGTQGRMLVSDLAQNSVVELSLDHQIVETHNSADSVIVEGPSFMAVGPGGEIYVVNALGGAVSVFSRDWRRIREIGGFGDGPGFFSKPKGVAVDDAGRVYVADALFDNVQIFDSEDNLLLTLGAGGSQPGQFLQPMGIAIDRNGRLFVTDRYNGRIQVYRWENLQQ